MCSLQKGYLDVTDALGHKKQIDHRLAHARRRIVNQLAEGRKQLAHEAVSEVVVKHKGQTLDDGDPDANVASVPVTMRRGAGIRGVGWKRKEASEKWGRSEKELQRSATAPAVLHTNLDKSCTMC